MKDRYLLLNNWIYQVLEDRKEVTKKGIKAREIAGILHTEFLKDSVTCLRELAKGELIMRGVKI